MGLRKVNLKLNPSKCEFLKKKKLYLDYIIGIGAASAS